MAAPISSTRYCMLRSPRHRAAHPLAGKAGEAVAGWIVEQTIQSGAWQAIQRAFRVEKKMTERHAHDQRTCLVGATKGGHIPDGDGVGGTA